jgi:uncharacterized membrane protein YczE
MIDFDAYVDPHLDLTVGDVVTQITVWGIILVIFLLRNQFVLCKMLWYVIKVFFITLFVMLFANYAKDSIKKWWSE